MKAFAAVVLSAIVLLGCRKDIQNKDAVKQAITEHLAKRTDLMALNVTVSAVKFKNNEADALVYLESKDGPPGTNAMEMRYALERQGNKWVVKGRGSMGAAPNGADPHGGVMPGTDPHSGGIALPPGHPTIPDRPRSAK